eukprot:scaffold12284_cov136-Isochrysis_galbana.AAC.5
MRNRLIYTRDCQVRARPPSAGWASPPASLPPLRCRKTSSSKRAFACARAPACTCAPLRTLEPWARAPHTVQCREHTAHGHRDRGRRGTSHGTAHGHGGS